MSTIFLFSTNYSFPFGDMRVPVYENTDRELHIHVLSKYQNGSIRSEVVYPLLRASEPFLYTDIYGESSLHDDVVSIGEKVKEYDLIECSYDKYQKVNEDVAAAVTKLLVRSESHLEKINTLTSRQDTISKRSSKNKDSIEEHHRQFHNLKTRLMNLFEMLRLAFKSSNKWRGRLHPDFFSVEEDDDHPYEKGEIPF